MMVTEKLAKNLNKLLAGKTIARVSMFNGNLDFITTENEPFIDVVEIRAKGRKPFKVALDTRTEILATVNKEDFKKIAAREARA